MPIVTGTLPVFDEICKSLSRFINSCLRSRYSPVAVVGPTYSLVLPCTALFMVNIIRLLVLLGFVVVVLVAAGRFFVRFCLT